MRCLAVRGILSSPKVLRIAVAGWPIQLTRAIHSCFNEVDAVAVALPLAGRPTLLVTGSRGLSDDTTGQRIPEDSRRDGSAVVSRNHLQHCRQKLQYGRESGVHFDLANKSAMPSWLRDRSLQLGHSCPSKLLLKCFMAVSPWQLCSWRHRYKPCRGHRKQTRGTESRHEAQKADTRHRKQTRGTESRHEAQKADTRHRKQTRGTESRHEAQKADTRHRKQTRGTESRHEAQKAVWPHYCSRTIKPVSWATYKIYTDNFNNRQLKSFAAIFVSFLTVMLV